MCYNRVYVINLLKTFDTITVNQLFLWLLFAFAYCYHFTLTHHDHLFVIVKLNCKIYELVLHVLLVLLILFVLVVWLVLLVLFVLLVLHVLLVLCVLRTLVYDAKLLRFVVGNTGGGGGRGSLRFWPNYFVGSQKI